MGNKVMSIQTKIEKIKGGLQMRKLSIILALALSVVMVMGISTAFAAGEGDATSGAMTKVDASVYGETYVLVPGSLLEPFGTDAKNANGTGIGNLRKTVSGQKVHGSYKTNSNSCASCHVTHNAPGAKLLFKSTVYNTCTTCHDGTLGYLNVFQTGEQLKTKISSDGGVTYDVNKMYAAGAGTFRYTEGKGASMHMANGAVTNGAAPGGNKLSTDTKSWGAEFSCASCHAPHGSYSTRLLHYNANNIGLRTAADGGNFKAGEAVTFADGKYTVADKTTPWLYGYTYGSPKNYWSKIYVDADNNGIDADDWKYDATQAWNDVLHMNYKGAYFTDDENLIPAGAAISMDVAPAVVAKFELDMNNKIIGYGETRNNVSKFCAACHTDYNAGSNKGTDGTFSQAHRHTINRGATDGIPASVGGTGLECLSCHFAHGSNQDIMLEADNTFATTADINPSSALKRYVNQGICVRCHTSSSASTLKNSDGYWDGDMANKVLPQLH